MSFAIDLPNELYLSIFNELNHQVLGRCCQVSTRWNLLASDNALWADLYNIHVPHGRNIKEYYRTHVIKSLEEIPRFLEEMALHSQINKLQRFMILFQTKLRSHLLQYEFGYSTEKVATNEKVDEVKNRIFKKEQLKICYFVTELPDQEHTHWKTDWHSSSKGWSRGCREYSFRFVELHESEYIYNRVDYKKIKDIIANWQNQCSEMQCSEFPLMDSEGEANSCQEKVNRSVEFI